MDMEQDDYPQLKIHSDKYYSTIGIQFYRVGVGIIDFIALYVSRSDNRLNRSLLE